MNPERKAPFRRPKTPGGGRQGQRLTPQFNSLRNALTSETTALEEQTTAPDPELIAVLELVGTVTRFVDATRHIEGLQFLTDFMGDGVTPDDDFYYSGEDDDPSGDLLPQSLYLVMANARAIDELVRLFDLWKENPKVTLPTGLFPLKEVFAQLHTIRRWGPEDRVRETGLLEDWQEDVEVVGAQGSVLVEIELVWGQADPARTANAASVRQILDRTEGAKLLNTCEIESINYHGMLAELPYDQVAAVLQDGPGAIALLCTNSVLFVGSARPMTLTMEEGVEPSKELDPGPAPSGAPRAALLDGVPLSNHALLASRLRIDDPDEREAAYTADKRRHGTAMASLMIHGDLEQPNTPIASPIHVHPVLVPHEWTSAEVAPPHELFIDVIHRAFQRMFGQPAPRAESVRIVNLSLGEPAKAFAKRLSPLARLLDHLSYQHNILIVVSAGNHPDILPVVPAASLENPTALAQAVRTFLHEHSRQRRLLAPADSINALTVGAIHDDGVESELPENILDPLPRGSVALYSPVGFGFKRSPKPEIHAPGGRSVALRPIGKGEVDDVQLDSARTEAKGPGLLAAAPTTTGATAGTLYTHGTSNAAALVSHHAIKLLHSLEGHKSQVDEEPLPDAQYHPVLLKALLVHASSWQQHSWEWARQLGASGNEVRRLLTQQLGFGVLNPNRSGTAEAHRVCLVGAGSISKNARHSYLFPLPSSLATPKVWKRLTVSLAWLSPIEANTQQYRVAHLTFPSPRDDLRVEPKQVVHYANGKGTILQEVLEGERAAGFVDGTDLKIDIDCRVRVGKLAAPVRYALVASLEVAPALEIDLHQEVRDRLATSVRQRTQARVPK